MSRRSKAPSNRHAVKASSILADIAIRRPGPRTQDRELEIENVKTEEVEVNLSDIRNPLVTSLLDLSLIVGLVFGGCCANVCTYEYLLNVNSQLGTALAFSQMAFISAVYLPSFIVVKWYSPPSHVIRHIPIPWLKPTLVPFRQWLLQVVVLTAGTLLNNWSFAYHVPLTVQIVFRSAGLPVSMLFGRFVLSRTYSWSQMMSVCMVTIGVTIATTSGPKSSSTASNHANYVAEYTAGIVMLTISLFLQGWYGLLQEKAYTTYRPSWREGIFYTHLLSLVVLACFSSHIKQGYAHLAQSTEARLLATPTFEPQHILGRLPPAVVKLIYPYTPYLMLLVNMITQTVCVSGVNQLTSKISSVSTNLVLTSRKAISLLISVWLFGNTWNSQLGWGTSMVFIGSIIYASAASSSGKKPTPPPPSPPPPPSLSPSPAPSPPRPTHRSRSNTPRPRQANGKTGQVQRRRIKKEE